MDPPRLTDVQLLERLVAFDTSGERGTAALADFVEDYLAGAGVAVERHVSPESAAKVNLVARCGAAAAGVARREGLVLAAHADVVPAGDGWDSDPFVLVRRDGRLYGRGSADMKGFAALAINALHRRGGRAGGAPLFLILTYDEEIGALGAMELTRAWPPPPDLPRQALIGEPTRLGPVRAHKGHLRLRVVAHGRSAHSGYPDAGVNAIEAMGRVLAALGELRLELRGESPPGAELFPEAPFVVLNVGLVRGGDAINVVPARCEAELGLRTLPGLDPDELVERVAAALPAEAGGARLELQRISDTPPMRLAEGAAILRAGCDITGHDRGFGVPFATDAAWLQQLELDCLVCGPGDIEVAHKPNEFIGEEELDRGRDVLDRFIERFCDADRRG